MSINLDMEKLFDLLGDMLDSFIDEDMKAIILSIDIDVNFEIVFSNNFFQSIAVVLTAYDPYLDFELYLGYTDEVVELPEGFLDSIFENEYYTYNLYIDGEATELKIDKEIIDELVDDFYFYDEEEKEYFMSLIRPYKKGFNVVGLFKDASFSVLFDFEDLLIDGTSIYVKFEEILDFRSRLENLFTDDDLLIWIEYEYIYAETDKYILIQDEDNLTIKDKQTNKYYIFSFFDDNLYELLGIDLGYNSLISALDEVDTENLLAYKDVLISLESNIGFIGEELLLLDSTKFGLPMGTYSKWTEVEGFYDFLDALDSLIDLALVDEVEDIDFEDSYIYVDIVGIEDYLRFIVDYTSGLERILTLKQLKEEGILDYILPTEDNGFTFTLIVNGVSSVHEFSFYDSRKGPIIVVAGVDGYTYLSDLTLLPVLEVGPLVDFDYYLVNNFGEIHTLADLQNYSSSASIWYLSAKTKPKALEDIITYLNTQENMLFDMGEFKFYYDFEDKQFVIKLYNGLEQATVKFTNESLIAWDNVHYYEVSLEGLNTLSFNDLYLQRLLDLYIYFNAIEVFYFVDAVLNNKITYENLEDNTYYFDGGLRLTISNNYLLFFVPGFTAEFRVVNENIDKSIIDNYYYEYNISSNLDNFFSYIKTNNRYDVFPYNNAYSPKGYVFGGYYLFDENDEPDFNNRFFPYENTEQEMDVFVVYNEIISVMEYLERFKTLNRYIIQSAYYEFRIDRSRRIEFFDEGELAYIIDLVNDLIYYFNEDEVYQIIDEELLLNFVKFIDELEEEQFFMSGSQYNLYSNYYQMGVNMFQIDLEQDGFILSTDLFYFYSLYRFKEEHFELTNIENIEPILDEFLGVEVTNSSKFMEEYSMSWYMQFIFTYKSGLNTTYDYWSFMEEFDGRFELSSNRVYYFIDDVEYILELSDFDLYVIDTSIGTAVCFEELGVYYYLDDLEELPVMENGKVIVYTGWMFRGYTVDMDYLRSIANDYSLIALEAEYEFIDYDALVDVLEDHRYLEIDNQSFDIPIYYDIIGDVFIIDYLSENPVFIYISDFNVTMFNGDTFISFDYNEYNLKDHTYSLFGINNFEGMYYSLFEVRDIVHGSYTVQYFYYSTIQFVEGPSLYYSHYDDNVFVVGSSYVYTIDFIERFEYMVQIPIYSHNFELVNDIVSSEIIFKTNNPEEVKHVYFNIDYYAFYGYYYFEEEGENPNLDMWFDPNLIEGSYKLFAYYNY